MSRFRILALLGGLSSVTVSPIAAQQQSDSGADVRAFVRQYIDATNRADATALTDMYARVPEVTSADNGDITRGWDAIRASADSLRRVRGRYRIELGSVDVVPLGPGHALAVAAATFSFGTAQGSLRVRGVYTFVLRTIGGAWKIIHDHSSYETLGGG